MLGMKWPRSKLRMIVLLVIVAAIALSCVWFCWPLSVNRREQSAFEDSARQIKVGMPRNEWTKLIRWNSTARPAQCRYDSHHVRVGLSWLVWPDAIYCIFYRLSVPFDAHTSDSDYTTPCSSVEVFRLPPVPSGYRATSATGKIFEQHQSSHTPSESALLVYVTDFADFISGDRKADPGFACKLVYSDPPK
jgi:hypothetical protein